ncbi:TraM recognition domain-containing protein, partial [Streptococcus pneumoniae]
KDTFNIIAENCKTKIVLGGATGESAEVFSKLIGEEEYTNMSVSQGDKSLSTSTSINKKRIMSADQIRLLKTFELVCISDNLKPFLDDRKYYFFDNISYFLYKKLPFDIQRNDEIIKKYNAWKNKKQTQEVVQEKKIHIHHERQEVNEEKVMIRQEKVQERTLTKQEEIQKLIAQRRKRDLD